MARTVGIFLTQKVGRTAEFLSFVSLAYTGAQRQLGCTQDETHANLPNYFVRNIPVALVWARYSYVKTVSI